MSGKNLIEMYAVHKKCKRKLKMRKTVFITALVTLFLQNPVFAGRSVIHGATAGEHNRESILIHADRDFYIAGERLYFRLDLINSNGHPSSSIAYLVLRNLDNAIIEKLSIKIDGNTGNGSIYLPDTLSSSVYQLVAFTNWMRNFNHDEYGKKQITVVNRFDQDPGLSRMNSGNRPDDNSVTWHASGNKASGPAGSEGEPAAGSLNDTGYNNHSPVVRINPVREVYKTREKAEIEITGPGAAGPGLSLSVAVVQRETLIHNAVPGRLTPQPEHQGEQRGEAVMIYPRETNGPVITGRVTRRTERTGIEGATVFLNTPDSASNLLYAQTLSNGVFHFRLNEYHEGRQLYFSVYDRDIAENAEIDIHDKYRIEAPFRPVVSGPAGIPREFITTSQDIVRVNKTLGLDFNRYIHRDKGGYRPEIYARPAYSFSIFADYVLLNDLQEIARELLPWLRIREQDGIYDAYLFLERYNTFTRETPAFFLDGIYADDVNRIIHLNSEDILKIELQNYPWRYGRIAFPGIVALYTREQEYRNLVLAEPSVKLDHRPSSPAPVYEPPDYERDDPGLTRPDFRQLLFWDPDIRLAGSGEKKIIGFFTGDIKGEFIITVRGIAPGGGIISEQEVIIIE